MNEHKNIFDIPEELRLATIISNRVQRGFGHKAAITDGGAQVSYEELDQQVDEVCKFLTSMGANSRDRVLIILPTGINFIKTYFACHKAGLVVMPLNPLLGEAEVGHILKTMKPTFVVSASVSASIPLLAKLPDLIKWCHPTAKLLQYPDETSSIPDLGVTEVIGAKANSEVEAEYIGSLDDEALILFTSGTSGMPKGVSLSQRTILTNALQANVTLGIGSEDVLLCPLPLAHVFGQCVLMIGGLLSGSHLVLVAKPSPDNVYKHMVVFEPSFMAAVPTTYAGLSKIAASDPEAARQSVQSLRMAMSGGSGLPTAVSDAFMEVFGKPIFQGYGMTEVACCISLDNYLGAPTKAAGYILPTIDYRIASLESDKPDEGELEIRGPNIFQGYYIDGALHPRESLEWFPTGDLARIGSKGDLTIFDRKKELIIRGGYNVYPSEVERTLSMHPGVLFAAVVGVEDEDLGQEVGAFVELHKGFDVSPEELAQWCKSRIALYKYPRKLAVLGAMPLNPTGKILKSKLDLSSLKAVCLKD